MKTPALSIDELQKFLHKFHLLYIALYTVCLTKRRKKFIMGTYFFSGTNRGSADEGRVRMKIRQIRLTLMFVMIFGALFVVLPGLGRLMMDEAPITAREPVRAYALVLTAPSNAPQEQVAAQRTQVREETAVCRTDKLCIPLRRQASTDANGNVVAAGAYYKCVPEAFALGDAKT